MSFFPSPAPDTSWARSTFRPLSDNAYDLGSSSKRFRDLYLSRNLILSATSAKIISGTSDAADNSKISLGGGGDVNSSRGSYLTAHGNENGVAGAFYIVGGAVSTGHISQFLSHSSAEYRWYNSISSVMWTLNDSGNWLFSGSSASIRAASADGSDNQYLTINGGGGYSEDGTRGAGLALFGNEQAGTAGRCVLFNGSAGSYNLDLRLNNSGTDCRILNSSGSAVIYLQHSGNIIVPGTSNSIIHGASSIDADVSATFGSPGLYVLGSSASRDHVVLIGNGANAVGARLDLAKTRSSAADANTVVNNNDEVGAIRFFASDGASYKAAAMVAAFIDGTPGASDMPSRLEFYTTPDGSGTTVRRWYVQSNGHLMQDATNGGDIYYYKDTCIRQGSSDGSDNLQLTLGNTNGNHRGSYISVCGNEHANTGSIQIVGGNVANADVVINASYSGASVRVLAGGADQIKFLASRVFKSSNSSNESTGAGSAALGSNCPAVTSSAPYTWLRVETQDGSTCYLPVWK